MVTFDPLTSNVNSFKSRFITDSAFAVSFIVRNNPQKVVDNLAAIGHYEDAGMPPNEDITDYLMQLMATDRPAFDAAINVPFNKLAANETVAQADNISSLHEDAGVAIQSLSFGSVYTGADYPSLLRTYFPETSDSAPSSNSNPVAGLFTNNGNGTVTIPEWLFYGLLLLLAFLLLKK